MLLASTGTASAQFSQYTQPGSLATATPQLDREAFEQALEDARWRLGGLRLDPWLGIKDAGWYRNPAGTANNEEADFSITAGAGLRAYLPVGSKIFVAAHALPEYVYWQDASERRRLNGRYGAGVFAYFNRLTFSATGTREDERTILVYELPREVNQRRDALAAALELEVTRHLTPFVEVSSRELTLIPDDGLAGNDPEGRALARLDRTEDALRAGLRYQLGSRWTFGAGIEESRVDFAAGDGDRSNRGTSPLVQAAYRGPNVSFEAEVVARSLEAQTGAEFVPFEDETGGARLEWNTQRLGLALYARRSLGFGLGGDYPYFVSDLVGLGTRFQLGRRSQLLVYAEQGNNDYVVRQATAPPRSDDFDSLGAQLTFELGRGFQIVFGGTDSKIESTLPGNDRRVSSVRVGISLGAGGPWL